jgi:hypothetical protein
VTGGSAVTDGTVDRGQNFEEWDRHFGKSRFHTIMKWEGRCLAEHLVAFPVTFVYE